MGWLILIAYLIGAGLMGLASVRVAAKKSDYAWDMNDVGDVAALTAISVLVAVVWPLVIIAGLLLVTVKQLFANAEAEKR